MSKILGPYTLHDFGFGQRAAWRHGWRDGEGRYDRSRNVIGAAFRGRIADARRLPA